jgi:tRNA A37 threonylcarbamoyltransferase TsaD
MKVLAIESSCDDTSFSVVSDDKSIDFIKTINHRKFHKKHGGVIPEMAARQHLDIMDYLQKSIKKVRLQKDRCNRSYLWTRINWGSYRWFFLCKGAFNK